MTKFYLLVKRVLPVLFLAASFTAAFAQGRTVSGKVTSADDGSTVPGVNILEKGTSNGTVTDADGNYRITVGDNATLVFSFVGYATQESAVGAQATVNITLQSDVTSLSEVVVVGYGSQEKKEITGSVVSLSTKDFNKGQINDPAQLLQGKVAGLSIYNRGGDPNTNATLRLRGISTVGANQSPLIVIDGVLGASLDNVDPNDIETVNVLKDGSAAAIYGSRGSSGVILITTKRGSKTGGLQVSYNGYISAQTIYNQIPNMTTDQYIAAGGNNLGARTDWQKEVTQTGVSNVHNISIAGGDKNTQFRLSTNLRNINGVLKKSGFDQINARANVTHTALNDKLKIDLSMSVTNRNIDYSFNEALRYAVLYNPTAPIKFAGTDNYYQAILFDNFNPVAILNQNTNTGKQRTINYNANASYQIIDNLTVNVNAGQQYDNLTQTSYYSSQSLFRGFNRNGLARRYVNDHSFSLFEAYLTYAKQFGKIDLSATAGYSFQEDKFADMFVELGNFPNDQLGANALQTSGDRLSGLQSRTNINSNAYESRIIAQFARVNLTFDNSIFFNASVRREGSTKLGTDNQYGIFPSVGAGVDLNKYINSKKLDILKLRVGYGVTGSLPLQVGLSKDQYDYSLNNGGGVSLARAGNKNLKWEQKQETNIAVDFSLNGKLSGSLDFYSRDIKDFILGQKPDAAVSTAPLIFQNSGSLNTKGVELSLQYNSLRFGELSWTPGIVVSHYKTKLTDYQVPVFMNTTGPLGSPGQNSTPLIRNAVGEEVGQIWGPVFAGVEGNGAPRFADTNGDGVVNVSLDNTINGKGDYVKLGNGLPSVELGWKNALTFRQWDFNIFFRGAFGHSLVNSYRAFYEPIDPGAINSYNRITTSKAVPGLTSAQFSSLYVEKADFMKLDNVQIGYTFKLSPTSTVRNVRVYVSGQNLLVITSYTGIDPEPVLADTPSVDNGAFLSVDPTVANNVLAPGIDRRNNYFTSRTFTFGLSFTL